MLRSPWRKAVQPHPVPEKPVQQKPILQETAVVQGVALIGALSPLAFTDETLPGGEGFLTYRKMQHDPQVKACLSTKKVAVLSRGWEIHPATQSDPDREVADFCRQCLNEMRGSVLDVLYDAMDALALGVSILELNWKLRPDGLIGLESIKAKDPAYFLFETDPFLNITAIRGLPGIMMGGTSPGSFLATPSETEGVRNRNLKPLPLRGRWPRNEDGGGSYSEDINPLADGILPVDKFIIYPYQPSYANPMGTSDLRAAWQPWFVKQQIQRWWAKYMEKFGLPTVTGSYDPTKGYGIKQQREFLSLLSAVHNESALVYPSDMKVALLDSERTSDTGFVDAMSYLDRAIAKSILGQSLTSDSSDRGATYGLGAVQANVLSFYLQKLQRDLEIVVMQEQVLKRLIAYNFPPGAACPTFRLGRIDDDRLAATSALIQMLITGGVIAPDEPWIRGYLGIPESGPSGAAP